MWLLSAKPASQFMILNGLQADLFFDCNEQLMSHNNIWP